MPPEPSVLWVVGGTIAFGIAIALAIYGIHLEINRDFWAEPQGIEYTD